MASHEQNERVAWIGLALGLCILLGAQPISAQGKGKGGGGNPPSETEYPVTVGFRDALDDKVTSDGAGAYVHGVSGVRAVITAIGHLSIQPSEDGSGARQLFLLFSDEWPHGQLTCGASPAEPCAFDRNSLQRSVVSVTFTVLDVCGTEAGVENGLLGMAVGEQRCARMAYWFDANAQEAAQAGKSFQWTERFRPVNWPETNDVIVMRHDDKNWTIEAVRDPAVSACPDAGDCSVLLRSKFAKGGKATLFIEGFFHQPFQFTVTRNQ